MPAVGQSHIEVARHELAIGQHLAADDEGEARPADDTRNLAALAATSPALAGRIAGLPLQGRAAVRAAST